MPQNCIFCKIIKGEMPCYKIYEDKNCLAFLDISKDYYAHTLVIPKKHFKNVLDIPVQELSNIMQVVQKISTHLCKNCKFDGVTILNSSGQSAEQSVFHLHFHIIPRLKNDNLHLYPSRKAQNFDLEKICNEIKMIN